MEVYRRSLNLSRWDFFLVFYPFSTAPLGERRRDLMVELKKERQLNGQCLWK